MKGVVVGVLVAVGLWIMLPDVSWTRRILAGTLIGTAMLLSAVRDE